MSREFCYRCFWPKSLCWCSSVTAMPTRTRLVLLMHPKEFKREKAATGRLTHLCLAHSEIQVGIEFDHHDRVQELIQNPRHFPVLLFPGRDALNLSAGVGSPALAEWQSSVRERELVVFVLDATWALGRKMLKLSPSLQRLPKVMFTPTAPSRFVIKQQPAPGCLSTIESIHELLVVLEQAGLDRYPMPDQLLSVFTRMQNFQIRCAEDPQRSGYRRTGYRPPAIRRPLSGKSGSRRTRMFCAPAGSTDLPDTSSPLPASE